MAIDLEGLLEEILNPLLSERGLDLVDLEIKVGGKVLYRTPTL